MDGHFLIIYFLTWTWKLCNIFVITTIYNTLNQLTFFKQQFLVFPTHTKDIKCQISGLNALFPLCLWYFTFNYSHISISYCTHIVLLGAVLILVFIFFFVIHSDDWVSFHFQLYMLDMQMSWNVYNLLLLITVVLID